MESNKKRPFWSKEKKIWVIVLSLVVLVILLVRIGILPDPIHEAVCTLFTSTTQRLVGNACN